MYNINRSDCVVLSFSFFFSTHLLVCFIFFLSPLHVCTNVFTRRDEWQTISQCVCVYCVYARGATTTTHWQAFASTLAYTVNTHSRIVSYGLFSMCWWRVYDIAPEPIRNALHREWMRCSVAASYYATWLFCSTDALCVCTQTHTQTHMCGFAIHCLSGSRPILIRLILWLAYCKLPINESDGFSI